MNDETKIKTGDHIGHVVAWGILKGTKAPQVFVKMDIGLTWFGSFSEGRACEIAMEALVVMGYSGPDDMSGLITDPIGALDKSRDLRLSVDYEADLNGDMKPRINWVNDIAGPGFKNQMDDSTALAALKSLKLKGNLLKARKDKGVTDEPKRDYTPEGSESTTDGIPF